MKKIIHSQRYDTEAPQTKLIGKTAHGRPGEASHWEAGLYRTNHGNYFIAGRGGPMARFGQAAGRRQLGGGGEDLLPLTPDEARAWAREHLSIDDLWEHVEGRRT